MSVNSKFASAEAALEYSHGRQAVLLKLHDGV